MLRYCVLLACVVLTGCSLLPDISHQPTLHNPFPQLSKVAVAPFFVLAEDPTLNGKDVAMAYFNELQLVPGFEVVPVGVVENAMRANNLRLDSPTDVRRLAQLLEVDAVVVGAVTDYSPWYPPRCTLQVEWYAANPGFYPIPPGYGLPWGTPEEEGIPAPLVFEAEMALAKAQLATQTPQYQALPPPDKPATNAAGQPPGEGSPPASDQASGASGGQPTPASPVSPQAEPSSGVAAPAAEQPPGIPPDWPDPRGFIPPPPVPRRPTAVPSDAPVLTHTRTYNGNDMELTEALASYYYFRDDARFGGWQGYLQRSDDFIRFCCHMHISEMLSARGGAGETRVVWRWPSIR
jgi:hypothetical protein